LITASVGVVLKLIKCLDISLFFVQRSILYLRKGSRTLQLVPLNALTIFSPALNKVGKLPTQPTIFPSAISKKPLIHLSS